MMQIGNTGKRMSEGVYGAQPLLKCHGAHHRRHHHVASRFQVFSVMNRARQILNGQLGALKRNGVAQGMVTERQVGLHVVGQRIQAGAGGNLRRHAQRSTPDQPAPRWASGGG